MNKHCKINYFYKTNKNITTKQKRKHTNPCQSRESNTGTFAPQSDALHLDTETNVSIEIKLLNCFSVMILNINKQMREPHFFNNVVFSVIFNILGQLYLAVPHNYGSRIHCLSMGKSKM